MIVVDATVAASWFLEPENISAQAIQDTLVESDGLVPGNFYTEVAQALLRGERFGILSSEQLSEATDVIATLPLTVKQPRFSTIISLARKHKLSAYDSAYLAVALDSDAPLATLDASLQTAAKSAKLLWSPSRRKR